VTELRISSAPESDSQSKKRKLDHGVPIHTKGGVAKTAAATNPTTNTNEGDSEEAFLQIKEVSMVVPHRKKFTIEFTESYIQARDPKTNELVSGTSYAWKDIGKPS
jgi:hypothetical protein